MLLHGDGLADATHAVEVDLGVRQPRPVGRLRRHVRLVDYAMHDGASARTWLAFETDADRGSIAAPAVPKQSLVMVERAGTPQPIVFETMHDVVELPADHIDDFAGSALTYSGDAVIWLQPTVYCGRATGYDVENLYDFTYALRVKKPGDVVAVVVKRNGQDLKVNITLEARR